MLKSILEIEKENVFLEYIVKRIQSENYRGLHISQHNRYDLDYTETVVKTVYELTKGNFFEIPRGDYSTRKGAKQSYDINQYPIFKKIVDIVKTETGKGTYNSIKKNFFVDFDRMGIIIRYDQNLEPIDNSKQRQVVYFGKLSDKAISFVKTKVLLIKYRLYTDFLDNLFYSHFSNLADLIYSSDYKETQISIYEFMFILSDENLSNDEKINLLNAYNSLKTYQKDKLLELIKEYANPDNFYGDKTEKRDFHNWINEAQQIFSLMKQTSYFQVDRDNIYFMLNIGNLGIFSKKVIKRSASVKDKYFEIHKIDKKDNFELHHIIPISKARNEKEVEELDNVDNLIYLEKNKHKEITRKKNKNVYLNINTAISKFCDFNKDVIVAYNNRESLYAEEEKIVKRMKKHNKNMLRKIYGFDKKIDCNDIYNIKNEI